MWWKHSIRRLIENQTTKQNCNNACIENARDYGPNERFPASIFPIKDHKMK